MVNRSMSVAVTVWNMEYDLNIMKYRFVTA